MSKWDCIICNYYLQHKDNITCDKCGTLKDFSFSRRNETDLIELIKRDWAFRLKQGKFVKLEGDWFCKNCHTNNFAKRASCYKCLQQKV